MPIDFFSTPCNNLQGSCQTELIRCLQIIPNDAFGISDSNANARIPAKVVLNDDSSWDLTVENISGKEISFKAIDYCVEIYRTGNYNLNDDNRDKTNFSVSNNPNDGQPTKRCEGFLRYEESIVFFEIKTGKYGAWLTDAREKLEETILSFNYAHPNHNLNIEKPVITNKNYIVHQNLAYQSKILKKKVGIDFVLQHTLSI
jgi:hypothetical protein